MIMENNMPFKTIPQGKIDELFADVRPDDLAASIDNLVYCYSDILSKFALYADCSHIGKLLFPDETTISRCLRISDFLKTAVPTK